MNTSPSHTPDYTHSIPWNTMEGVAEEDQLKIAESAEQDLARIREEVRILSAQLDANALDRANVKMASMKQERAVRR